MELKESLNSSVGKEICAFANASGGKIILGVKDGVSDGVKDGVKLTKNQGKIFKKIKDNPHITAEDLSDLIGINKRNVEKNLSKLQALGIIKRIGSDKGGHWKILWEAQMTKVLMISFLNPIF